MVTHLLCTLAGCTLLAGRVGQAAAQDVTVLVQRYLARAQAPANMRMTMTEKMVLPNGMGAMVTNSEITSDLRTGSTRMEISPGTDAGSRKLSRMLNVVHQVRIENGKQSWMYLPDKHVWYKVAPMGFAAKPNPIKAAALLLHGFALERVRSDTLNGHAVVVARLSGASITPAGKALVYVDSVTGEVRKIVTDSKQLTSGPDKGDCNLNRTTMEFNVPVNAATFHFIPPKGARFKPGQPSTSDAGGFAP